MDLSAIPAVSGIYRITCTSTGKFYIGSASNIRKRWREHRNSLRRKDHHSITLQRAWDKYGESAFICTVLELVLSAFLIEREQYWLDALTPYDPNIGYNIARSSQAPTQGRKYSAESREKLRVSHLGNTSAAGHTCSPDAREKMRLAKLGKKQSETHRLNQTKAHRGLKRSPEAREKMRIAALGRPVSTEARAKISVTLTGRNVDPEHNASQMKTLIVTSPDGTEYIVCGVKRFCREHHLDPSSLMRTAYGQSRGKAYTQHKGWTARFPDACAD